MMMMTRWSEGDKVELHAVLLEGVPWETDQVGDRKFKITVYDQLYGSTTEVHRLQ